MKRHARWSGILCLAVMTLFVVSITPLSIKGSTGKMLNKTELKPIKSSHGSTLRNEKDSLSIGLTNCLIRSYEVVTGEPKGLVASLRLGKEYNLKKITIHQKTVHSIEPKRTKQCPACDNLHCISYDPADCQHSNCTTCAWNQVLLKCVTISCSL